MKVSNFKEICNWSNVAVKEKEYGNKLQMLVLSVLH